MLFQEELTHQFLIPPHLAGVRLDRLLTEQFPTYSRTYFQFLIEAQAVRVNGQPVKKRNILNVGDAVEVFFILTPEISVAPEEIPLNILYEDEDLIAINKPPGMVVHPAPGHPSGTFVNALLFHCKALQGTDPLRPGIVHRLDKDTSGVLLAAKHLHAHAALVSLFAKRQIDKRYIAICLGTPPEGLIDAPIARHKTHRQKMCVDPTRGRAAQTRLRILCRHSSLSTLEVELLTGRTHQIRVHLQHIGCPILGDTLYGSSHPRLHAARQLLHAHSLSFLHPFLKTPLFIQAPLPPDILEYYFTAG